MNPNLQFMYAKKICATAAGYTAYVAQCRGLDVGYAIQWTGEFPYRLTVLTQVRPGHQLGPVCHEDAVRWTAAAVVELAAELGDVAEWFVPAEQRTPLPRWVCSTCGRLLCPGECLTFRDLDLAYRLAAVEPAIAAGKGGEA